MLDPFIDNFPVCQIVQESEILDTEESIEQPDFYVMELVQDN